MRKATKEQMIAMEEELAFILENITIYSERFQKIQELIKPKKGVSYPGIGGDHFRDTYKGIHFAKFGIECMLSTLRKELTVQ